MIDRKQYDLHMDQVRSQLADDIADYLSGFLKENAKMRDKRVADFPDEALLEHIQQIPIPQKGRDPKEVGDELVRDILSKSMNLQHPRFFSLVTSAVSPYSLAGTVLTDIYNPNLAGWTTAPSAALIEEKLVRWMGSRIGFDPDKCGGLFTSGGSLSNLTGMIAARENMLPGREDLPRGVAFISDQAHSSVAKGLRLMGLRDDQVIKLTSDDEFRMPIPELEAAIQKEIAAGRKPFLMVGSIGSTNTGEIDPLNEMADLAEKYNLWFHIDGAYGGSIMFSDIYKHLADGAQRADSMSWDTHKWSMQTYACSCLIAKDKQRLITAFNEHPEYLEDARDAEHNDGWDLGIEMSRPARALKLWYTVQAMGTDQLADVIDYAFFNARTAEKTFEKLPGWEIVSHNCCGALNVRYVPKGYPEDKLDELNAAISRRIIEDGYAYVITTTLKGKKVLRFCFINGNTTTEDVLNTVEVIDRIAHELA